MDFDISPRIIFLTMHGSHAYGMARPESDIDVKGVAIPPPRYFDGYMSRFEQFEGQLDRRMTTVRRMDESAPNLKTKLEGIAGRVIPESEPIDSVVYDIRKFFALAGACNPNIIEVLFGDESDHLVTTECGDMMLANRDLFLSMKAKFTFSGYAFSQLKRIRTHRRWLLHPPKGKPSRADYGLPERTVIPADQLKAAESLIERKVSEWVFIDEDLPREVLEAVRQQTVKTIKEIWAALVSDAYVLENGVYRKLTAPLDDHSEDFDMTRIHGAAGKTLGYDTNFLEVLDRERHYRGAIKEWQQYNDWKRKRNPARAKLEAKFGLDTKHASHLKRLLDMAKEILEEGKVIVKRPNAEELLAIRNGAWSYDKLIEWAAKQQEELDRIYEEGRSPLPKRPRVAKLDELCQEIVGKFLNR